MANNPYRYFKYKDPSGKETFQEWMGEEEVTASSYTQFREQNPDILGGEMGLSAKSLYSESTVFSQPDDQIIEDTDKLNAYVNPLLGPEGYLAPGATTQNTIEIFDESGQSKIVPASELEHWKSQGWNDKSEEQAYYQQPTDGEEVDPVSSDLQNTINNLDSGIDSLYTELDKLRVSINDASSNLIQSIKDKYDYRRSQMRDLNMRSLAAYRQYGIRMGTARYSPLTQTGIMSAEESAGISRLSALDAEESALIAEAQQAIAQDNYSMLHDQLARIEEKRDEKVSQMQKILELQAEAQKELDERNTQIRREASVISSIAQGITNPAAIFASLGGMVTLQEVNDVLDTLMSDTIEAKRIDGYTNSDGQRVNVFWDPITGMVTEVTGGEVFKEANLKSVPGIGLVDVSDPANPVVIMAQPGDPGKPYETLLDLRSKFRMEPLYRDTLDIYNGFLNIQIGARLENAGGDLMIVNGIAKMLDPGSVVRPAEFATVEESQGVFQRLGISFDKFMKGNRLHPDVRAGFLEAYTELWNTKKQPLDSLLNDIYGPLAGLKGLDIRQVGESWMFAESKATMNIEELAKSMGYDSKLIEEARTEGYTEEQIRNFISNPTQ